MSSQKNTIVINGKTYDATSGALVSSAPLVSDIVSPAKPVHTSQPLTSKTGRSTHHLNHHKTQRSITLKRHLGHKATGLTASKSVPIDSPQTLTASAEKILLASPNRHDKSVPRSKAISKFGPMGDTVVIKHHPDLVVNPAPPEKTHFEQAPPLAHLRSSTTDQDIFATALSHATSHQQKAVKVSHRKHRVARKLGMSIRAANITAAILVVTVLGSFVAYQNAANISMHLATGQSGLADASLPAYRPSGFALNRNVAATPGQIVISFRSNSDARAFTVTQASSSWNSQTLADSFLAGKQSQRISQTGGKTVFFYGDANATWVDGGIWYRIEGNSSLNQDQLLKLANSF